MPHSEVCPVCKGVGMVYEQGYSITSASRVTCHGCNGAGWVIVPDEVK